MINTVLFDLDGTLLPMDMDEFMKDFFIKITKKMEPYGYKAEQLKMGLLRCMNAMVKNDGSHTNEEVFWKVLSECIGERVLADKFILDEFYLNEFNEMRTSCGYTEKAKETVNAIKKAGYRVALATNPFCPAVTTENRIRWAGLEPGDFELYTTYENSHYCKPNIQYYYEVISKMHCSPEECLMVGNDVKEDMVAQDIGMQVFLLTDCLINKEQKDITIYQKGGFEQLIECLGINYLFNEKQLIKGVGKT